MPDYDVISFGSYKLDSTSGIGGIVRGRLTQLVGDTGAGKSTLAILLMIEAQKAYPEELVGFIDVEQAFNKDYAEQLGLDTDEDKFILIQADSANQALDLMLSFTESNMFSLVVLDSVASLIPDQNLNANVGDQQVATLGRLLSNETRKFLPAARKTNTALLWINQWRAGIGFGQPEKVLPGGGSPKYYPSVTIDLKRKDLYKKGEDYIGMMVQANFTKNRFANPYQKAEYNLYFGEGIRKADEAVEVAYDKGFITRAGAWYTFPKADGTTDRTQGMASVIEYYKDNPEDFSSLEASVIKSFKKNVIVETPEDENFQEDV